MARNEEKQQGRLNRLWLQRERDEGRLRDAHVRRPKLSTLNSASSVKKWLPSIKNEIEYCLQQSQLSHYPERKITEFQLRIEALEREYKRFTAKLRALDASCKEEPWTPRAYRRRRAEERDLHLPSIGSPVTRRQTKGQSLSIKKSQHSESHEDSSQWSGAESDSASSWTGSHKTSANERQGPLCYSETGLQTPVLTEPMLETSEAVCVDQDQPLSFDRMRLAVAAAAFRGPSVQLSSSQTQSLTRVLQSGLPNLSYSPSAQIFSLQSRERENIDKTTVGLVAGQKDASCKDCDASVKIPEKSPNAITTEERTGHVLGLDCYSSSDEDCDT